MMIRQQLLKYQYQQQLLFSTAQRRRKKPKLPSTTKDRLRHRGTPPTQKEMKIDSDLVTERMQTRLDWIRSNIESLWKDPNATTRPDRYEFAMDGNWWKWNILLALSPGILIAAYCEFVAKPMMLEQRREGSNGLPRPNASSFFEDLYHGLMHYMYGMEPVGGNKQIQYEKNNTASDSISPQGSDLQQLQALKDQIRDLEERMTSKRPQPGIRQRHQMNSPKPEEQSDSTGESTSSAAGWVLQKLTESVQSIQQTANHLLFPAPETQGNDKSALNADGGAMTSEASDTQDEEQLDSSQDQDSTSLSLSEEKEDGIAVDDSESSRRWWQLWK